MCAAAAACRLLRPSPLRAAPSRAARRAPQLLQPPLRRAVAPLAPAFEALPLARRNNRAAFSAAAFSPSVAAAAAMAPPSDVQAFIDDMNTQYDKARVSVQLWRHTAALRETLAPGSFHHALARGATLPRAGGPARCCRSRRVRERVAKALRARAARIAAWRAGWS
jgi:hypothetical protein